MLPCWLRHFSAAVSNRATLKWGHFKRSGPVTLPPLCICKAHVFYWKHDVAEVLLKSPGNWRFLLSCHSRRSQRWSSLLWLLNLMHAIRRGELYFNHLSPRPPRRVEREAMLHNGIPCITSKHKQGLCRVKRSCTAFMLKFLDCSCARKLGNDRAAERASALELERFLEGRAPPTWWLCRAHALKSHLSARQTCLLLGSKNNSDCDRTVCQHDPMFCTRFVLFVDTLNGSGNRRGVSGSAWGRICV